MFQDKENDFLIWKFKFMYFDIYENKMEYM